MDSLAYKKKSGVIKPQTVIEMLYEITKGEAIVTSDVGQHQMWAAQYYKFDRPRRWINSGGLGTMGVGLPYAMGVQFAYPDATVACITGEASIQMCIQELSTAQQYSLPIKVITLNNRYLGMVRQWQELFFDKRYASTEMVSPDFVKLAEAYDIEAQRVSKREDLADAIKTMIAYVISFLYNSTTGLSVTCFTIVDTTRSIESDPPTRSCFPLSRNVCQNCFGYNTHSIIIAPCYSYVKLFC